MLPIFAATIVGGIGSIYGAVLGGFLVGIASNLALVVLPSGYSPAVPFLIILAVLLIRPNGLVRRGAGMIGLISYLVFFTTVASILAIAVLGLNLQWGNTGLFNGGVVAFFGAGGYGTLILGGTPQADHLGGFEPAVSACADRRHGDLRACWPGSWASLTLRLRHDYLAIATFGVAVAFENADAQCRGPGGRRQGPARVRAPAAGRRLATASPTTSLFLIFVTDAC